jgi:hypothetical protein
MHKFDNLINQCSTFPTGDILLVVDDIGIISKMLMMLYIAGYISHGLLHEECRVVSLAYHQQKST